MADALSQAQASNLDLVEISPNAEPPVCRIMDFGRYLFDIKNYSYRNLNENEKIEYFISHEIPNGRMFSIYRTTSCL